jgi:hypothetical protein
MKHLPQFGVRRWRSCRVLATEVSGDCCGVCRGGEAAKKRLAARILGGKMP